MWPDSTNKPVDDDDDDDDGDDGDDGDDDGDDGDDGDDDDDDTHTRDGARGGIYEMLKSLLLFSAPQLCLFFMVPPCECDIFIKFLLTICIEPFSVWRPL